MTSRLQNISLRCSPRLLPWIVGVVCLALTLALSQAIRQDDENKLNVLTKLQIDALSSEIKKTLESREGALKRIVAHWERFGRPNAEEWAFDTELFVRGQPAYESIGWVDPKLNLRWLVPRTPFEETIRKALRTERYRREMLERASREKTTILSHILRLSEGGHGVRLALPIFYKGRFDGFIVAAFRLENSRSPFISPEAIKGFGYSVRDQKEPVLSRDEEEELRVTRFQESVNLPLYGVKWHLTVWPTVDTVHASYSVVSWVALAGGAIFSLLTAFATRFVQETARRIRRKEWDNRRQLEERERANTDRKLSALMEAAPDPMIVLDGHYLIDTCNSATSRLFGYELAALRGSSVSLLFELESGAIATISPAGLEMHTFRSFSRGAHDLWLRRRDGSLFAADIEVSSLSTEAGFFRVASIRDVTERHQAQAALKKKSEALERSNKELENFAAMASHDLQEPLRMISAYLGIIRKNYEPLLDANGKEFIFFCIDASQRLNNMIKGLLSLARVSTRSADTFAEVDTNGLLKEVVGDLRVAICESEAQLLVPDLPKVIGEKTQLHQVFQNLIANAIKFRKVQGPLQIEIRGRRRENAAEFSISDNGIGFEMGNAERVFGIFQRLHSRDEYAGTGMGLALCRRIIELHGGKIWVEAEPSRGSTFFFTLPAERIVAKIVPVRYDGST